MKNKAFTLAEIMIVLSVIAVLTAILLPAARNAMPNENVMKFKKGHSTLINVIQELVNSDKYYLNGDLGIKPNGDLVDGTHSGDKKYLCETFADIISIKSRNCQETSTNSNGYVAFWNGYNNNQDEWMDSQCKLVQETVNKEIISSDGNIYYRANPFLAFGSTFNDANYTMCHQADGTRKPETDDNFELCNTIDFSNPDASRLFSENMLDINGLACQYILFCLDIDNFNQGEDPFAYGIRHDGKIILGKRASEWLKKNIQEKN